MLLIPRYGCPIWTTFTDSSLWTFSLICNYFDAFTSNTYTCSLHILCCWCPIYNLNQVYISFAILFFVFLAYCICSFFQQTHTISNHSQILFVSVCIILTNFQKNEQIFAIEANVKSKILINFLFSTFFVILFSFINWTRSNTSNQ